MKNQQPKQPFRKYKSKGYKNKSKIKPQVAAAKKEVQQLKLLHQQVKKAKNFEYKKCMRRLHLQNTTATTSENVANTNSQDKLQQQLALLKQMDAWQVTAQIAQKFGGLTKQGHKYIQKTAKIQSVQQTKNISNSSAVGTIDQQQADRRKSLDISSKGATSSDATNMIEILQDRIQRASCVKLAIEQFQVHVKEIEGLTKKAQRAAEKRKQQHQMDLQKATQHNENQELSDGDQTQLEKSNQQETGSKSGSAAAQVSQANGSQGQTALERVQQKIKNLEAKKGTRLSQRRRKELIQNALGEQQGQFEGGERDSHSRKKGHSSQRRQNIVQNNQANSRNGKSNTKADIFNDNKESKKGDVGEGTKTDQENLHPSWQAKLQQRQLRIDTSANSNKIIFDDD